MAVLTVQTPTFNGVTLTGQTPAGGGDSFANDGDVLLLIRNASGSSITITFDAPGTTEGLALQDPTAVVPTGGSYVAGPFPPQWFNDSNGRVNMTYSSTTSLTLFLFGI